MGNQLDAADSTNAFYLFGSRSVYVGDWYFATVAECSGTCSGVYAFNADHAALQEIMVEKESKIYAG